MFDIDENRALSWLLATIQERADVAGTADRDASAPWLREIRETSETVRAKRRTAWLESVPATWPGDAVYPRLNADRGGFYRLRVATATRYLRRLLIDPDPADVVKALCERYFEPSRDWQLFEIAVVLRICRHFEAAYVRVDRPSLLIGGRGPFASYRSRTDGREIRIWYQAWPPSTAPSELNDALTHYAISSAGTRPDIVCEVLLNGKPARAIVLELKASRSASYLAAGLSQLLGYLRDRPALTSTESSGWLVPLDGLSFTERPAEGRSMWVVDASVVAERLIDAVG
ncbi:hypothetical protein [Blastococcus sp. KM273129]|uniref:hypothetical protein n=1 Tax=Blastococcus sp. KM273129 TaxID=2570315 RepID=UPI001F350D05|nr:hypothetical protein [Blastococcus sp. KM273129]MCF6735229.1 hypothetical protein [Blastococcus sp. KM273129]